jgi:uncharacterized protein (DUF427 family)
MADKVVKIPGPDHPISIEANPSRIVVKIGGRIIADTSAALTLREASYPPVQYIPRRDVDMSALTRSEHTSYCPYKGDASYYDIPAGGDRSRNAVWTYKDPFEAMAQEHEMASMEEKNKCLVLEAFDKLFNKRDYEAAARYWAPNYIQHSAHIEPGREGLFNLIKTSPASLKYEPGVIVAEGDFVIVHGRFSGTGLPRNWIAADIVRIADGVLAEHWDVLQDEAARADSKSGLPMFGDSFAGRS